MQCQIFDNAPRLKNKSSGKNSSNSYDTSLIRYCWRFINCCCLHQNGLTNFRSLLDLVVVNNHRRGESLGGESVMVRQSSAFWGGAWRSQVMARLCDSSNNHKHTNKNKLKTKMQDQLGNCGQQLNTFRQFNVGKVLQNRISNKNTFYGTWYLSHCCSWYENVYWMKQLECSLGFTPLYCMIK